MGNKPDYRAEGIALARVEIGHKSDLKMLDSDFMEIIEFFQHL